MPMSPGPIRQAFSDPEPAHEVCEYFEELVLDSRSNLVMVWKVVCGYPGNNYLWD